MLGEDSGLELAALGGRPGVETARWAGGRHVERALEALAGEADRSARYVCELVALSPEGRETRGTGTLEGHIALEPRGERGLRLRSRSSFPTGRSERSPSSATRGRRSTRTAPARRKRCYGPCRVRTG